MKLIPFITAGAFIVFSGFMMKKKNAPLYETKWSLRKIYQKDGVQEVNTRAFIKFDEAAKRAGGNGSCNSFGGNLFVERDSIRLSQLVSTKMFCTDVQDTENRFFGLLGQVNRFEIKENTLLLYQDKKLLLGFEVI